MCYIYRSSAWIWQRKVLNCSFYPHPGGGKSHPPTDPRDGGWWEGHDVKIRMQMYTESIHCNGQPFPFTHFIFVIKQIFFRFPKKIKQKPTIAKKLNYFGIQQISKWVLEIPRENRWINAKMTTIGIHTPPPDLNPRNQTLNNKNARSNLGPRKLDWTINTRST